MIKVSKYESIGLDTNIFVYYFQKNLQFGPVVKELFRSFLQYKTEVATSSITLTELLSAQIPTVILDILQEEFFLIPFLKILPVDNSIAIEAARIRREYIFKLPDSIQLATALNAKANAFITNDDRLKKFKELKVILLREL